MTAARRTPRFGDASTRTGLAARINRSTDESDREKLVTTRGTDELLARAREASIDLRLDESTLATVESRLREV